VNWGRDKRRELREQIRLILQDPREGRAFRNGGQPRPSTLPSRLPETAVAIELPLAGADGDRSPVVHRGRYPPRFVRGLDWVPVKTHRKRIGEVLNMEETPATSVLIGQDAGRQVGVQGRSGGPWVRSSEPNRPIASFIFSGTDRRW